MLLAGVSGSQEAKCLTHLNLLAVRDGSRISLIDSLETSIIQSAPFAAGFLEIILAFLKSARMLLFGQVIMLRSN